MGLAFAALLGIVFLLFFLLKDRTYSVEEHRSLAQVSEIPFQNVFGGELSPKTQAYVNDQFPFRNALRRIRTRTAQILGEREYGGIYKGSDNWLIEAFEEPRDGLLAEQTASLNSFAGQFSRLNQYFILVPSASEILKPKLPKGAYTGDEEAYLKAWEEGLSEKISYIDISKTLRNHRDEYIYYRTEPCWTSMGAYFAFREAAPLMGLSVDSDRYEAMPVANGFRGVLSTSTGYAPESSDTITLYFNQDATFTQVMKDEESGEKSVSLYDASALETEDKLDVFFGGAKPQVTISTTSLSNRKLLVLEDRYGSAFVPFLMTGFSEITVVNPSLYEGDIASLVRREGITDILYLYQSGNLARDESFAKTYQKLGEEK